MKRKKKFGRVRNQRKAFINGLAFNLIMKGKIKTTLPRAKELKMGFDRLVTYAKKNNKVEAFRLLGKVLPKIASGKLINEIAPKYPERKGGYTRIIRLARRKGDAAAMAYIELV